VFDVKINSIWDRFCLLANARARVVLLSQKIVRAGPDLRSKVGPGLPGHESTLFRFSKIKCHKNWAHPWLSRWRQPVRLTSFQVVIGIFLLTALLGTRLSAQQAQISLQEEPHYVGEPIIIRVTAEGFEEQPQPECQPGKLSEGLALQFVGVQPSVSSYTQVINGRVSSHRTVVYAFDFHAVAQKPGIYRVAPFTITQQHQKTQTQAFNLNMKAIEADDSSRVALVLPGGAIYPGQRVPVEIQWWYAGNLNEVRNLIIRSPLFDQFSFIDEPLARDDVALPIQSGKTVVKIKAHVEKRTLNGREFVVLIGRRELIVDKPGLVELDPISASVGKVTRWRRGFFGRREPDATQRVRAMGKRQTVQIKALPLDQAPPSFSGAVGHGFTIGVEADRTVLNVGDPVMLTITLRGDGNLAQVGPPRLSSLLDAKRFRSPAGNASGLVTENRKEFSMTVRVLDESASEIPPIEYAWFDPTLERFATAQSQPIALRVLPGQMVTARDVVSSPGQDEVTGVKQPTEANTPDRLDNHRKSVHSLNLTDADLTIEINADQLAIDASARLGGYRMLAGVYTGSVLVILVAWWRRIAAQTDPAQRHLHRAIKEDVQRIRRAGGLSSQEAASEMAMVLRRLASRAEGCRREEIDHLVAECDAVAFAPTSADQKIDATLQQRAKQIAETVMQEML